MNLDVIQIAKVAHDTNASFCASVGDHSQVPWDVAPEWQKESAVKGVEFHLSHLRDGNQPPASSAHDAWLFDKVAAGWRFGPTKDAAKREHPCLVPYEQLPVEQRMKDYLFGAVVRAFFDCFLAEV